MQRLVVIGCAVLASACDIAGPVGSEDADATIFEKSCTGRVPELAASFSIDAVAPRDEGVRFEWAFSTGSSNGVFAPVLDCGWWTPTYFRDGSSSEDSGSGADEVTGAACLRGAGPARQIVSVHGRVAIPFAHSGQQVSPFFAVETLDQDQLDQVSESGLNTFRCPD